MEFFPFFVIGFFYRISATLHIASNLLCFLLLLSMKSQGPLRDVDGANPNVVACGIPPIASTKFRAQRPAPFFQGFPGAGNQMPFLYPHSLMPPTSRVGFAAAALGTPSAMVDLTKGSQKQGPHKSVTDYSKSNKKRRGCRKKTETIKLDDAKEDVELLNTLPAWPIRQKISHFVRCQNM